MEKRLVLELFPHSESELFSNNNNRLSFCQKATQTGISILKIRKNYPH